jgi:hypothetical protein
LLIVQVNEQGALDPYHRKLLYRSGKNSQSSKKTRPGQVVSKVLEHLSVVAILPQQESQTLDTMFLAWQQAANLRFSFDRTPDALHKIFRALSGRHSEPAFHAMESAFESLTEAANT